MMAINDGKKKKKKTKKNETVPPVTMQTRIRVESSSKGPMTWSTSTPFSSVMRICFGGTARRENRQKEKKKEKKQYSLASVIIIIIIISIHHKITHIYQGNFIFF